MLNNFKRDAGERRTLCALFDGVNRAGNRTPKRSVFKCLKLISSKPSMAKPQLSKRPQPPKRSFLSCFSQPAKRRCVAKPPHQENSPQYSLSFHRSPSNQQIYSHQISSHETASRTSRWTEFDDHESAKGHERFFAKPSKAADTSQPTEESLFRHFEESKLKMQLRHTKQKKHNHSVAKSSLNGRETKRGTKGNSNCRRDQQQPAITSFMSPWLNETRSSPVDLTSPSRDPPVTDTTHRNSTCRRTSKHFDSSTHMAGVSQQKRRSKLHAQTVKRHRQCDSRQNDSKKNGSECSEHGNVECGFMTLSSDQEKFWEAMEHANFVSVSGTRYHC